MAELVVAIGLIIIVLFFLIAIFQMWFTRPMVLYQRILSSLNNYTIIDKSKYTNESQYIEIESGYLTNIIKYKGLEIFLMHFGIAGTFRKKFYLVVVLKDVESTPGLYGGGHIYRELTSRILNINKFKIYQFKLPASCSVVFQNYECVEVYNGKSYLFFSIPSLLGYQQLDRVLERLTDDNK